MGEEGGAGEAVAAVEGRGWREDGRDFVRTGEGLIWTGGVVLAKYMLGKRADWQGVRALYPVPESVQSGCHLPVSWPHPRPALSRSACLS